MEPEIFSEKSISKNTERLVLYEFDKLRTSSFRKSIRHQTLTHSPSKLSQFIGMSRVMKYNFIYDFSDMNNTMYGKAISKHFSSIRDEGTRMLLKSYIILFNDFVRRNKFILGDFCRNYHVLTTQAKITFIEKKMRTNTSLIGLSMSYIFSPTN